MKIGLLMMLVLLSATPRPVLRAGDAADDPGVSAGSLPAILATEAWRMTEDFPQTRYRHQTLIDPERGICEVDCSGFVVAILRQKSPAHLESIKTKHKRPLAEDFYAAFAPKDGNPARGWRRIDRLADAKAGDVLAWVKQDQSPGDNTGHVVLIAQKPLAESPQRYRVRVFDSTLHGHASDERTRDERSGIGEGTFWVEVNSEGRPIGYRWKSRTGIVHLAPIAVGRAVPISP
jgi:hypothetical protein